MKKGLSTCGRLLAAFLFFAAAGRASDEDDGPVKHLGLRGFFGYGAGLSGAAYGTMANHQTPYVANLGSDLAYAGEILWAFNRNLEVGLGLFAPIGAQTTGTSDWTDLSGGQTRIYHDQTDFKFQTVPFIASLYLRQPVMRDWTLLAGLGAGWATGGDAIATSHWTQGGTATGGGTTVSDNSFNGDVAYRGLAGLEYSLSRNLKLFAGLNAVGANFAFQQNVRTASSTVNGFPETDTTTTSYLDNPPERCDSPTITTVDSRDATGTGTVTTTNNQSCIITTTTNTYVNKVNTSRTVQTQQYLPKGPTQTLDELALQVGMTWYF
jgi:hypothetical protein